MQLSYTMSDYWSNKVSILCSDWQQHRLRLLLTRDAWELNPRLSAGKGSPLPPSFPPKQWPLMLKPFLLQDCNHIKISPQQISSGVFETFFYLSPKHHTVAVHGECIRNAERVGEEK